MVDWWYVLLSSLASSGVVSAIIGKIFYSFYLRSKHQHEKKIKEITNEHEIKLREVINKHKREIALIRESGELALAKEATRQIKILEQNKNERVKMLIDSQLSIEKEKFLDKDLNRLMNKRTKIKGTKS